MPPSSTIRIGYVPEHYSLPLHLAKDKLAFPVELIPFPSGTGHMITALRFESIDVAIGLTEGWVVGLLTPQGQQERGYSVVGSWVQSPLRWAIVTGRHRDDIRDVSDLKAHRRLGVSRMGSGSHVMALVLAQQEGWLEETTASFENLALDIVPSGPFADLRDAVTGKDEVPPTVDFFMWEHFTTKPYFNDEKSSPLKRIGEIYTPWPSWHISASSSTFPDPTKDERLAGLFKALDESISSFSQNADEAIRLLGTGELGFHYDAEDAREWLKSVKFADATRGVDPRVMEEVVQVLQGAGVLERSVTIKKGDGVVGIESR